MADRGRVLVVDDDGVIRGFLAEVLADEAYEVRVAADGEAALAILDGWRPDLIVLDLWMPGMDGPAFLARQRALPTMAAIPVVVLSAIHGLDHLAADLAVAAVYPKPFDLEPLLGAIAELTAPPTTPPLGSNQATLGPRQRT